MKKVHIGRKNISLWTVGIIVCLFVIPILFIACEYSNEPAIIYKPDQSIDTTGRPFISGILPATQAVAGVREITIIGTNLGIRNGTDTNWVLIGGVKPIYKDIQNSAITIYRPQLSDDKYGKSIYVNITDPKLLGVSSSFTYLVESPGAVVGDYTGINSLNAIEFDNKNPENIYIEAANKNVYKTDFPGVTQTIVLNPANLLSSDFAGVTSMSFGPGSSDRNLFMTVSKPYVYRIIVYDTLNKNNKPVKLNTPTPVHQLDFDESGNLFTAGIGNIYYADTSVGNSATPTFSSIGGYTGGVPKKMRLVKESGILQLYIADSLRVWKGPITTSSFSGGSPLVDLTTKPSLSGCFISSIEVDANGTILLCIINHAKYSLFVRESDGSITPFYTDSKILPKTAEKLAWGNNKYLYLISSSWQTQPTVYAPGRVYIMTLDRNGAPYNGRTFVK